MKTIKDDLVSSLLIAAIPGFFAAMILGVKVFWCVFLSDSNCWSHFP